jgi:type IV pilus assembly protein PilB
MNARTPPEALASVASVTSAASLREALATNAHPQHSQHLGSLLVERGLITPGQLRECLHSQDDDGDAHRRLGTLLVERGLLRQADLDAALVELLGIPTVDLAKFDFDFAVLHSLPKELVRELNVLPLARVGEDLVFATAAPLDTALVDKVRFAAQRNVRPVYAPAEAVAAAIEVAHAAGAEDDEILKITHQLGSRGEGDDEHAVWQEAERLAQQRPVVRLVNGILSEAVLLRASDVHVRPRAHSVEVLLRVDGSLVHMRDLHMALLPALVSRVKIMSRLDIAERRLPQDGHTVIAIGAARVDLRVSTIPTRFGESVVIRILNKQNVVRSLDELGLKARDTARLRDLLRRSYGMLLVTGPTGSGKTTTLYAALRELMKSDANIVTVEDPVEYEVSGIRQIQVAPQIGFGFAQALRHILRHDPDAIMIGEIRDAETCRMAVESALTGHLVLSTLHTNDAPSTIVRLLEMGVEPYLIKSAVIGVLAQRLVRCNCPGCSVVEEPDALLRAAFDAGPRESFYRGRGCGRCHDAGFAGRAAVYELMSATDAVQSLIRPGASADELRAAAVAGGMTPLMANGLELARTGAVSLSEVYRACA